MNKSCLSADRFVFISLSMLKNLPLDESRQETVVEL